MNEWERLAGAQNIDKTQINKLILDYLIFEGYESTSAKFANEIGIELESSKDRSFIGFNSIRFRKDIKQNILNGEIQMVINKLNLHFPDLLEKNQFLYFKLLLLNLIEMIKVPINTENQTDRHEFILNIIKFAQEKLTNKAIKNTKFMEELELAMTLLLYSNNETKSLDKLPTKLKELLKFKLRRDISELINKSIIMENSEHLVEFEQDRKVSDYDTRSDDEKYQDINNDDDLTNNDTIIHDDLIDSNLKKMIKFWIWGENKINQLDPNDEFFTNFKI